VEGIGQLEKLLLLEALHKRFKPEALSFCQSQTNLLVMQQELAHGPVGAVGKMYVLHFLTYVVSMDKNLGAHLTSAAFKDRSLPTHFCTHPHHPSLTLHSPSTHPRPLRASSIIMDSVLTPNRDLHTADGQHAHSRWPPVPLLQSRKRLPSRYKNGSNDPF